MTKFMTFNPKNDKPVKKTTEFKYKIVRNMGTQPEIQTTTYAPENFNNIVYLYRDNYLEWDVFMAWNEDITNAWIFYGTKGDEFE